MSRSHSQEATNLQHRRRASAAGRWRPADVVILVVAGCYGATALLLACAIVFRLVR